MLLSKVTYDCFEEILVIANNLSCELDVSTVTEKESGE